MRTVPWGSDLSTGEIIKRELKRQGISQKELAKRMGMTPTNLSNIINERTRLTQDNAKKLESILGISSADLIERQTPPSSFKIIPPHASLDLSNISTSIRNALQGTDIEKQKRQENVEWIQQRLMETLAQTISSDYEGFERLSPEEKKNLYDDVLWYMKNRIDQACSRR